MKVKRLVKGKIVEIELTPKEILQAHDEYIVNLIKNVLKNDFKYNKEMVEKYSIVIHDRYYKKNGKVEYEFIKSICDEFFKANYI